MEVPFKAAPTRVLLRDLLIAPVIEELVFRACIMQVLLSGGWQPVRAALVAPVFFGIAHVHHVCQAIVFEGRSFGQAAASQAFSMLYTTVFGALAGLLYLSTGTLASACALHAGCNWFGMPRLTAEAKRRGMQVPVAVLWLAGVYWSVIETLTMLKPPFALALC
jgi:prenyl protein peptidase